MNAQDLRAAIRFKNVVFARLVTADNEMHKRLIRAGSVPEPWRERRQEIAREYRAWVRLFELHQATRQAEFELWVEGRRRELA